MHLIPSILFALLLCACSTDREMGRDAASAMGAGGYVAFQRNAQPDTAALFYWRSHWRLYHPTMGTERLETFTDPNQMPLACVLSLSDALGPIQWIQVPTNNQEPLLTNGCLPRAIREARLGGGGIVEETNHARYYVQ